jgi:VanZ family protein
LFPSQIQLRAFLKYWLPVVVWMAVIFTASADTRSYQHSEEVLGLFEPLVHWLFPSLSPESVGTIHEAARKCCHLAEYGVFALLLWRAMRRPVKGAARPWHWPQAGIVLSLVFLYAASDEFHQRFVPTRTARVADVFIDTFGGAAALGALWLIGRLRKRW